MNAIIWTTFH